MQRLSAALLFLTALGWTQAHSGFDLSQLDRTADPCTDFYQYACGGWIAQHPLPADKSRYGRYDEMAFKNRERLQTMLEAAAAPGHHSALEKQVGDYYAACMDEAAIDRRGAAPLEPYFQKIAAVKDHKDMARLLGEMKRSGLPGLFGFGSTPDPHDARVVIGDIDQGGLSLPDRDYFLKEDPKSVERRQRFAAYVAKALTLAGDPAEKAAATAQQVLALETGLAKASLDRVSRREPKNLDHRTSMAELTRLAPNFEFPTYFKAAGAPKFESLNVSVPGFFAQTSKLMDSTPLDTWKAWLRWRVVRRMAPALSKDFVDADFQFSQAYLRGTKQIERRSERCVRVVDADLGEASGKLYVEKYFGREGKQKIQEIVANIAAQLEQSIKDAEWMTPETKQKALFKLTKIDRRKLGYPEKFRDYSKIKVERADYAGNLARAAAFDTDLDLNKIGKPVDKSEWGMTPPTVNAYYDPQRSEIVFPAGILQPPMFDLNADDGYSYGAIGRVTGHELTHGFDDEGRKFDAEGNLTDWWTESDSKAFEERAECIADQYSHYSPVDDGNGKPLYLNGKLTLGENVADNGGVRMAYYAYLRSLAGKEKKVVDGFTPEQRLFLGYAVSRCENVAPETSRLLVVTDPHSPGKFRLIGPLSNMDEFRQAFGCKEGQPMAPARKCRVW